MEKKTGRRSSSRCSTLIAEETLPLPPLETVLRRLLALRLGWRGDVGSPSAGCFGGAGGALDPREGRDRSHEEERKRRRELLTGLSWSSLGHTGDPDLLRIASLIVT